MGRITFIFLAFFLIQTSAFRETSNAANFFDDPLKKSGTVVLDPGHGGSDYGNRSKNGLHEKNITLALAKLILKELEKDYRVHLTRNDDYKLSLLKRASIANNKKGDIFISLHSGNSLNNKATNSRIMYYLNTPGKKPVSYGPIDYTDIQQPRLWDSIQLKHMKASFELAKVFKSVLGKNTVINGGKIFVLKGADMPAVLIETDFLSNSVDSKNLSKNSYIKRLAVDISKGIRFFLRKSEKNN